MAGADACGWGVSQQPLMVDYGGLARSTHWCRKSPGAKRSAEIKLIRSDAAAVVRQAEDIKARYTKYFKV